MAQEIEIEYKNLLTKEEYNCLLESLPFPETGVTQTNHYFETKDFSLKQKGCALRIREKRGTFQLTLKEPHPQGLLETHDSLSKQEANDWIAGNIIAKENTSKQLVNLGISPANLIYYGNLTTERRELHQDHVLIVLDYSRYNGKSDYELEVEAPSREIGVKAFHSLLERYHIKEKHTPNKIKRFFAG
jgi:uncharacterized protein YjbK